MSDRRTALRGHLLAARAEAMDLGDGDLLMDLDSALADLGDLAAQEPHLVAELAAQPDQGLFESHPILGDGVAPPDAHLAPPTAAEVAAAARLAAEPVRPAAPQPVTIRARNPEHQPMADAVADLLRRYLAGQITGVSAKLCAAALDVEVMEFELAELRGRK